MLFFERQWKNIRKHRDIELVTTDTRRNKLVSQPNYHTTKCFPENLLAIEMKKTKVKMNKYMYFGMSVLDISKKMMYEFQYDYVKPKYQDFEKWFDILNYSKNSNRHEQEKNMVFSKMN